MISERRSRGEVDRRIRSKGRDIARGRGIGGRRSSTYFIGGVRIGFIVHGRNKTPQ